MYPDYDRGPQPIYKKNFASESMVAKYCNMSIIDVLELDCISFYTIIRDIIIENNSKTEEGIKWLNSCAKLIQTSSDDICTHGGDN